MREGDRITVDLVSCTDLTVHHHDYGITYVSSATDKQILKNYIERTLPTLESDDCIALTQFMYEWANYVDSNNTDVGNTRRIIDITNGQAIYFSTAWIYNVDMDDPYYAISVRDVSMSISAIWLQNHCESTGGLYLCTNSGEIDCGQLFLSMRNDVLPGENQDKDGDGVLDYLEIQGIYTTNHEIYYSNPYSADTDNDSISDKTEYGKIYELSHYLNGRGIVVRCNGNIVYESESSIIVNPQYYYLNQYINRIKGNHSFYICVPFSNPSNIDTDEDGFLDNEDAIPNYCNPEIIYIFAKWILVNTFINHD